MRAGATSFLCWDIHAVGLEKQSKVSQQKYFDPIGQYARYYSFLTLSKKCGGFEPGKTRPVLLCGSKTLNLDPDPEF